MRKYDEVQSKIDSLSKRMDAYCDAVEKKRITVYHGTDRSNLESIRKKGLSGGSRSYGLTELNEQTLKSVFVTKNKEEAAEWAVAGGAKDPVILKIILSKRNPRYEQLDPEEGKYKGRLFPKLITGVASTTRTKGGFKVGEFE